MNEKFMTNDELKQAVPAAFAHKPHPAVSEKYSFVSTKKVIDMFEKHGWYPVFAKERKSKKASDVTYNKHLLRFRRKNPLKIHDGLEAEILHINSHNRSSRARFAMGAFRMICENGLVIADTKFSDISKIHMHIDEKSFFNVIEEAVKQFGEVAKTIAEYEKIKLTSDQKRAFANKVIETVWGKGHYQAADLLKPLRKEDESNDLFTVYNVIQEKVTKGGIEYKTQKGKKRHTSGIKSIDWQVKYNTMMWQLMENYRQKKQFSFA